MVGLNQLQFFTIPEAARELPHTDKINTIRLLFDEWKKHYSAVTSYFPLYELLSLDWIWKDGSGRTLIQRIDKVLKQYKIVLGSDIFGSIGNSMRETIPSANKYIFDIVTSFKWRDGTFQDGGSCMFYGRSDVKDSMEKDGRFYALRFFVTDPIRQTPFGGQMREPVYRNGEETFYGEARCWLSSDVIQIRQGTKIKTARVHLVFNSYGMPLREMASVLATKVGAVVKKIKISNLKKVHGGLYINSSGYVIGDAEIVDLVDHVDLGMQNTFDQKAERSRQSPRLQQERERAFYNLVNMGHKKPKKTFWISDAKKKPKKVRNRITRGQRLQTEFQRLIFYNNRDMLYDLVFYDKHAWLADPEIQHPMTERHYWRVWYSRLFEDFWAILIKLITFKINQRRYSNDTSNIKGGNPPKCTSQGTESTLRRDERTFPYEDLADSSEIRTATIHDEIG